MAACTQRAGTMTPVKTSEVRGSGVGVEVGTAVGTGVGEISTGGRGVGDNGVNVREKRRRSQDRNRRGGDLSGASRHPWAAGTQQEQQEQDGEAVAAHAGLLEEQGGDAVAAHAGLPGVWDRPVERGVDLDLYIQVGLGIGCLLQDFERCLPANLTQRPGGVGTHQRFRIVL